MKNQSVSDFVAATMDAVLNSKEHKDLFATQYKKAKDSMCAKHGKMDSCAADDQEAKSKKSSSDSSDADDQDAKKKKDSSSDSSSASDMNDARKKKDSSDESSADDDNDARKAKKSSDEDDSSYADDQDAKKKKESSSDSSDADDQGDFDTSKGAGQHRGYERDDRGEYDGAGANKADTHSANTLASSQKNPYPPSFDGPPKVASAAYDVAIDSLLTASAALDSVGLDRGSALTLKIASLVVEAKKKDKKSKDSKKSSSKDSQSAKDKKSKDSKKDDKKSSSKDSHSAKDKKSDKKDSSKDSKKSSSK